MKSGGAGSGGERDEDDDNYHREGYYFLPVELWIHVLQYLEARDVLEQVSLVCRAWHDLSRCTELWCRFFARQYAFLEDSLPSSPTSPDEGMEPWLSWSWLERYKWAWQYGARLRWEAADPEVTLFDDLRTAESSPTVGPWKNVVTGQGFTSGIHYWYAPPPWPLFLFQLSTRIWHC